MKANKALKRLTHSYEWPPMAAMGVAMIAGAAMSLSSLSVVLNSLRLRGKAL